MNPTIRESEEITVKPAAAPDLKPGEIVLYQYEDRLIAHRLIARKRFDSRSSIVHSRPSSLAAVSALSPHDFFLLRGDASLSCDRPVRPQQILGKVIAVERHGRNIDLDSRGATIRRVAFLCATYIRRAIRFAHSG